MSRRPWLVFPRREQQDLAREMQSHVDERVDALIDTGLAPQERANVPVRSSAVCRCNSSAAAKSGPHGGSTPFGRMSFTRFAHCCASRGLR